jgi:hypothetical protein
MLTNILYSKTPIFSDTNLNTEVLNKIPEKYQDVFHKRAVRYTEKYKLWMENFPNEPLPSKNSLEKMIESMESYPNLPNSQVEKLNQLKTQLQSGQYCEGTNEHAIYRGNYEDRKLAFVWPTEEEAAIRQQEESELLAQINK